jgi:hypothetical protein
VEPQDEQNRTDDEPISAQAQNTDQPGDSEATARTVLDGAATALFLTAQRIAAKRDQWTDYAQLRKVCKQQAEQCPGLTAMTHPGDLATLAKYALWINAGKPGRCDDIDQVRDLLDRLGQDRPPPWAVAGS